MGVDLLAAAETLLPARPDLAAAIAAQALDASAAADDRNGWLAAAGVFLDARGRFGDGRRTAIDLLSTVRRWGPGALTAPAARRLRVELALLAAGAGAAEIVRTLVEPVLSVGSGAADRSLRPAARIALARSATDPVESTAALRAAREDCSDDRAGRIARAEVVLVGAAIARHDGAARTAVEFAEEGLRLLGDDTGGDRDLRLSLVAESVAALIDVGDARRARERAELAAELLRTTPGPRRQRALLQLTVVSAFAGVRDMADTVAALGAAAQEAADSDAPELEAICRSALGAIHEKAGRLDAALAEFQAGVDAQHRDRDREQRFIAAVEAQLGSESPAAPAGPLPAESSADGISWFAGSPWAGDPADGPDQTDAEAATAAANPWSGGAWSNGAHRGVTDGPGAETAGRGAQREVRRSDRSTNGHDHTAARPARHAKPDPSQLRGREARNGARPGAPVRDDATARRAPAGDAAGNTAADRITDSDDIESWMRTALDDLDRTWGPMTGRTSGAGSSGPTRGGSTDSPNGDGRTAGEDGTSGVRDRGDLASDDRDRTGPDRPGRRAAAEGRGGADAAASGKRRAEPGGRPGRDAEDVDVDPLGPWTTWGRRTSAPRANGSAGHDAVSRAGAGDERGTQGRSGRNGSTERGAAEAWPLGRLETDEPAGRGEASGAGGEPTRRSADDRWQLDRAGSVDRPGQGEPRRSRDEAPDGGRSGRRRAERNGSGSTGGDHRADRSGKRTADGARPPGRSNDPDDGSDRTTVGGQRSHAPGRSVDDRSSDRSELDRFDDRSGDPSMTSRESNGLSADAWPLGRSGWERLTEHGSARHSGGAEGGRWPFDSSEQDQAVDRGPEDADVWPLSRPERERSSRPAGEKSWDSRDSDRGPRHADRDRSPGGADDAPGVRLNRPGDGAGVRRSDDESWPLDRSERDRSRSGAGDSGAGSAGRERSGDGAGVRRSGAPERDRSGSGADEEPWGSRGAGSRGARRDRSGDGAGARRSEQDRSGLGTGEGPWGSRDSDGAGRSGTRADLAGSRERSGLGAGAGQVQRSGLDLSGARGRHGSGGPSADGNGERREPRETAGQSESGAAAETDPLFALLRAPKAPVSKDALADLARRLTVAPQRMPLPPDDAAGGTEAEAPAADRAAAGCAVVLDLARDGRRFAGVRAATVIREVAELVAEHVPTGSRVRFDEPDVLSLVLPGWAGADATRWMYRTLPGLLAGFTASEEIRGVQLRATVHDVDGPVGAQLLHRIDGGRTAERRARTKETDSAPGFERPPPRPVERPTMREEISQAAQEGVRPDTSAPAPEEAPFTPADADGLGLADLLAGALAAYRSI
ncbi:hypothetical protein ACQEVB_18690 [Pseudonocardia sp. CA-107938]|uniref:hypothetical protein n=1 Tax=Pseudonocardia sp. CA-107938 TaxID=3240021 RepID=UPI003D8F5D60